LTNSTVRKAGACLLVGVAVLFVPRSAAAQVDFGVTGGIVRSGASNFFDQYYRVFDDIEGGAPLGPEDGGRSGLHVGVFAEQAFGGTFGLRGEGSFVQRGHTATVDLGGPSGDIAIRLNYFDVGVLGRVNVRPMSNGNLYVVFGPVFGIRIGSDTKLDGDSIADTFADPTLTPAESDAAAETIGLLVFPLGSDRLLKRMTTSIAVGVGITHGHMLLEARFEQGLTSALGGSDAYVDALVALTPELVGTDFDVAALKASASVFDDALSSAKLRTFRLSAGIRF
jgi:hypothetical protein